MPARASRRSRVLVLWPAPPDARLRGIIKALETGGMSVDVLDPPGDGTMHPRAVDYDAVIVDPQVQARERSRSQRPTEALSDVRLGRLRIDAARRIAFADGAELSLSAREFALLHYFLAHPDIVFTRDALLRAVWGSSWRTEGSVTEYIRRLRVHLEPFGLGACIRTRKGFGYSFDGDCARGT